MRTLAAPAKINLALVVGPRREDGKHELVTILQPLELHDRITLGPAESLSVTGFADEAVKEGPDVETIIKGFTVAAKK